MLVVISILRYFYTVKHLNLTNKTKTENVFRLNNNLAFEKEAYCSDRAPTSPVSGTVKSAWNNEILSNCPTAE